MRCVGTVVRGIRTPIIKENDDLENIVVNSVLENSSAEVAGINPGDIITKMNSEDLKNVSTTDFVNMVKHII